MREKGCLTVLITPAPSKILFSHHCGTGVTGFCFCHELLGLTPDTGGRGLVVGLLLPGRTAKVHWARTLCILPRRGPGCEEAITQTYFAFHADDFGKINKAWGSAEAASHRGSECGLWSQTLWVCIPSPPLACL